MCSLVLCEAPSRGSKTVVIIISHVSTRLRIIERFFYIISLNPYNNAVWQIMLLPSYR